MNWSRRVSSPDLAPLPPTSAPTTANTAGDWPPPSPRQGRCWWRGALHMWWVASKTSPTAPKGCCVSVSVLLLVLCLVWFLPRWAVSWKLATHPTVRHEAVWMMWPGCCWLYQMCQVVLKMNQNNNRQLHRCWWSCRLRLHMSIL